MGYKIGSFNLRNLGLSAMGNGNSRSLRTIARIIRDQGFDVVALQEVLSQGKAFMSEDYAKKSILMELGPDWDFSWADAGSENGPPSFHFLPAKTCRWNKEDNRRLRLFWPHCPIFPPAARHRQDPPPRSILPRRARICGTCPPRSRAHPPGSGQKSRGTAGPGLPGLRSAPGR